MSNTLGRATMLAMIGLAFPIAAAAADPASAPARLAACTVIPETISRRGAVPESIRVSFSIENDQPADLARFTATAPAGALREFTARGMFAKGVMLADRVLSADSAAATHPLRPGVECMLTYIHFVDGSTWVAPQ